MQICPTINEAIKGHPLTLFGCFLVHPMSIWAWATWRLKLRSFASCVIEESKWLWSVHCLNSCQLNPQFSFFQLSNPKNPSHGDQQGKFSQIVSSVEFLVQFLTVLLTLLLCWTFKLLSPSRDLDMDVLQLLFCFLLRQSWEFYLIGGFSVSTTSSVIMVSST